MALGGPVLITEQLNIQFPSLREAMKSYILKLSDSMSRKLGGNIYICRYIYSLLVFQF